MCMASTPDIPSTPERQAVKLPDAGQTVTVDTGKRRRQLMAGIMTSANGVLTPPTTAKTTLG